MITTLRTSAEDCPTDRTCPSVHDLDTDPGHRYVICAPVTPGEIAVFRQVMAAGEIVGAMPFGFIPDANPALDRTREVRDPALRADRQYVILTAVTDPAVLTEFADLIGPDEQLGYLPVAQLAEV
jgi:hypothetical protein